MKAILSTTYEDKYLWFLPIVTWCWNKLGVEVICFLPYLKDGIDGYNTDKEKREKYGLIIDTLDGLGVELQAAPFLAPEHKEATYAQCSRLYAACLDLPEDEILITSDVDMAVFNGLIKIMNEQNNDDYLKNMMAVFGCDLVPDGQVPICYTWGTVEQWRKAFIYIYGKGSYDTEGIKTYQEYLDLLLGELESEHFRGNYWSKDQEELFKIFSKTPHAKIPRARPGTQWASKRYDRDDSFILDRLNPDTIDFHMNRPGYEPQNFEIILKILQYHYPHDNFDWLVDYTEQYKKLL